MAQTTAALALNDYRRQDVTGDPVLLRIQPDIASRLDDWRRHQHDLPSRPEAVLRLMQQALPARPKANKPK